VKRLGTKIFPSPTAQTQNAKRRRGPAARCGRHLELAHGQRFFASRGSGGTQNASHLYVIRWRVILDEKTLFRTYIWVWVVSLETSKALSAGKHRQVLIWLMASVRSLSSLWVQGFKLLRSRCCALLCIPALLLVANFFPCKCNSYLAELHSTVAPGSSSQRS
jgi:hypothetical protein